ncbi:hypothetical protein [Sulfuriflexus mobilis]|uniref:hypothetical protein n=1 Tax=Sulfuriflexus mobilis TaxID=1811807 RepID=UPI000F84C02E|nr:hypothetical protein [Sulfuriflexus mobilis]
MLFIIIIALLILTIIILRIKNKNIPNTSKMNTISKLTYAIWLLAFVFFMLNIDDGSKMQLPAALIFGGVSIVAMLSLIVIQLIKLKQ